MSTPRIGVIVASTRTVRFADHPLAWLTATLAERNDLEFTVIDVREHPLPFYDLPKAPAMAPRQYSSDAERALGEQFDALDGYVIIVNEFNHGYSAALKNVLDHFSDEFHRKPVAFVGYGNVGGARAIEQLRQVAAELEMVSIRHAIHITGPQMAPIREGGAAEAEVFASLDPRLEMVVNDLVWWSNALKTARAAQLT